MVARTAGVRLAVRARTLARRKPTGSATALQREKPRVVAEAPRRAANCVSARDVTLTRFSGMYRTDPEARAIGNRSAGSTPAGAPGTYKAGDRVQEQLKQQRMTARTARRRAEPNGDPLMQGINTTSLAGRLSHTSCRN